MLAVDRSTSGASSSSTMIVQGPATTVQAPQSGGPQAQTACTTALPGATFAAGVGTATAECLARALSSSTMSSCVLVSCPGSTVPSLSCHLRAILTCQPKLTSKITHPVDVADQQPKGSQNLVYRGTWIILTFTGTLSTYKHDVNVCQQFQLHRSRDGDMLSPQMLSRGMIVISALQLAQQAAKKQQSSEACSLSSTNSL